MKVEMMPGKYVVAVSGGVDSVALLDMLVRLPRVDLVVAHFDHGMRENSAQDREFVQNLAEHYGLPFEYAEGKLGKVSEAVARKARYAFLYQISQQYQVKAIVTAHHQDDVLETAIINILRGTGRKGLTALRNGTFIQRPLLEIPKKEILAYARAYELDWREDETNTDTSLLRNYVRHEILPRFDNIARQKFLAIIASTRILNANIDELLQGFLDTQVSDQLNRVWFISLPHGIAKEMTAAWLRDHQLTDFDKKTLERLVVAGKTFVPGKVIDVDKQYIIKVDRKALALTRRDR